MNKSDLSKAVAAMTGATQRDSKVVCDAVWEVLGDALASGEEVMITGFGRFYNKTLNPRAARDPRTGEMVSVPAHGAPRFSPAPALREKCY